MPDNNNTNDPSMLKVGKTLQMGKYRVEKQLSSGGFGKTYVVTNVKFGERWAMKEFFMKNVNERGDDQTTVGVSKASKEQFEAQREKFNKEARRLRQLHHPNIVHVEDLFDENGTSYYIMDYIEGGSLADKVKRDGPLSEPEVRRLLVPLLDALEHIHGQQMWHLDIKPGNILLKNDGQPVLIDFGASKQLGATGGQSTSSSMAFSMGYAPSEQIEQNFDRIGPWTDLYALGATLYKLLTDQAPPTVSEIQNEEEVAFSFPSTVSDDMRNLIIHLMKPAYRRRPQSVAEVRAMMSGMVGGRVVEDVPQERQEETNNEETVLPDAVRINEEFHTVEKNKKEVLSPLGGQTGGSNPTKQKHRFPLKPLAIIGSLLLVIGIIMLVVGNGETTRKTDVDEETANLPIEKETITVNGVSFDMVKVTGGTFAMGATWEQGVVENDEKPAHRVTLSDYFIGQTEVTQALWQAVMGSNPSNWKGNNLPVENVSWDDCQQFITKLNQLTGRKFRLPTEAEWEYAARGGTKSRGYKYAGSNDFGSVAWYDDNSGSQTHPVGQKQSNELGIYDMSGNVLEWCQDWYDEDYYSKSPPTNPCNNTSASLRVFRGGGWPSNAGICRVSYRSNSFPDGCGSGLGLRLAL